MCEKDGCKAVQNFSQIGLRVFELFLKKTLGGCITPCAGETEARFPLGPSPVKTGPSPSSTVLEAVFTPSRQVKYGGNQTWAWI